MDLDTFYQMYKTELQEACSIEAQLVRALAKMAEAAHNAALKQAIQTHCDETRKHKRRVEELLRRHEASPDEHTDQSMQAMLREAEKYAGMVQDNELRDAELIASLQRVEHYEVAVYGTLATWAKQLDFDEDLQMLHETLGEEKRADGELTRLAKANVNPKAAALAA